MAASLALVLGGCSTSGLPRGAQVVGGGYLIAWKATANGATYLEETTTHKIIPTGHLNKGEVYDFNMIYVNDEDSSVQAIVKAAIPVMPSHPRFVLYFLPSHD